MKKVLAVIITLSTLATLTACGKGTDSAATDSAATESATETVLETRAPIKVEDLTDQTIERGTVDGNVYTSALTNVTFTKPEAWAFATDAELAELSGVDTADLASDSFAESLAANLSVYDASAEDAVSGTSVNFYYENTLYTENKAMSDDEYSALLKNRFAANEALKVEITEESSVMLGGNEYRKLVCNANMFGMKTVQVHYFRTIGGIASCISVNLGSGFEVSDIEAMFS